MTTIAGRMLVDMIRPLILAAIGRGAVQSTGAEDAEELVQDCLASAAQMLDACEQTGKPLIAKSTAYYAIQRTKTGRRSTSAGRVDVLSPAAVLDGNVALEAMDSLVTDQVDDAGDRGYSFHDTLASTVEDPAETAGRHLDWDCALSFMNDRQLLILRETASGVSGTKLAEQLGVSTPRFHQLKVKIGKKVKACWRVGSADDVIDTSAWSKHIAAFTERRACRNARIMAARAA